jgi:hypothetical protein
MMLVGCMACSEEYDLIVGPSPNYISFSPMYSAFDGTHDYAVTPNVPSAAPSSHDADPILASSTKWEIDGAFVKREEFPALPAAIKLTTRKAGVTTIAVTAKTLGGHVVRSDTKLTIREANPAEFDAGEERYNHGGLRAQEEFRCCGVCPLRIELPDNSACGKCHQADSSVASELTPTQTAGYSHDDLIDIFTRGAKPARAFTSPFLRAAPMPDCIYQDFHTWEMTDEEKNGIVWKLRSIPPKVHAEAQ